MTDLDLPYTAVVTGASGGIGEQIARQLAGRGADLVLVARTEAALEALAEEVRAAYGVTAHVIALDLSLPDAGERLEQAISDLGVTVDVLVNNAGFGGFAEFWEQDPGEIDRMLAVNVRVLTDLSRRFLPGMVDRQRGRVLNVASTAAFQPGPLMAVYYASKAYVLSLSEALHEELRGTGVTVTALCPGPVETGFQAASKLKNSRLLDGPTRVLTMLPADKVAEIGVESMLAGRAVAVAGRVNQVQVLLPRLLPRSAMTRVIATVQARRDAH